VLVRYGECRIDVNAGRRELTVTGGRSLLASLGEEGVFIPSACGGRGTCSYCKVKLVSGGGPIAPTEEPLLTAEERSGGLRVSCQVKVRGDVAVEIPPDLLDVRECRGRVERIVDLTHDIKQLFIHLADPPTIDFVPGQYVQLLAPEYPGSREAVYRAYSIANPVGDGTLVELIVRLVPGGICTTWVFEHLREGDDVTFTGPYGDFRISDSDRPMIWVAGGSGMAPFWSIVRHMKETGIARPVTYFFGALAGRDMFLADELGALVEELPWFTFVPALSSPDAADAWSGETGLITEVLDRHIASPCEAEAYLCGSAGMIRAAAGVLRAHGIPEERTFYDEFT